MRIADVVFRQGHLSEEALTEAILSGERPDHLVDCDLCSRRALELGRWLDEVRAIAHDAADDVFPAEKLALQQSQIMRRLEQLDTPSRIIAFPAPSAHAPRSGSGRRVAPAWVGVAAAAGLVLGVIGGQVSARLTTEPAASAVTTPPAAAPAAAGSPQPVNASLLDVDLEGTVPGPLQVFDEMTPTMTQLASVQ